MIIQNMVHRIYKKRRKKKALLLTKIYILVNTKVTGPLKYFNLILKMKEKILVWVWLVEKINLKTAGHNVIYSVPARLGSNMISKR